MCFKYTGACMHLCLLYTTPVYTSRYSRISSTWSLLIWRKFWKRFFFNPAIFASWHYWIDRQLIQFHCCDYVHLPLLFQALSWKAWARTSKVSKARLAVTVSTVVKQKNAWKNWRFSPRYRKHWSSLKQRCFFGFPLLPMAFWPIAKFQMGARRFLDRPGKWLCHKVTFLPNTMRWQRTCHTLPQCFMANSLAMEALPRFTSRRQSHGCQPRGVNFYKLQLYNLYTAFLCFAVCFCMLRCSKHLCLDGASLTYSETLEKLNRVEVAGLRTSRSGFACMLQPSHSQSITNHNQLRSWIRIQKQIPKKSKKPSLDASNLRWDVLDFQSLGALMSSSTCPFTERPTPLSRPHRFSLGARKHSQTMKGRKLGW